MTLVAGIDSSTQSCKVIVVDASTGRIVREGRAPHPAGTSCDPEAWLEAARTAIDRAGGFDDVAAVSVGGQQHGMVLLDKDGEVIRDALLWNDTRSAGAAADLIAEKTTDTQDGASWWADNTGCVPVASFTVTKLRWVADNEPDNADRIAAICLPHDWLTWKLAGKTDLADLVTDRSDASGTCYVTPAADTYRRDIIACALKKTPAEVDKIILPRILGPGEPVPGTGNTGPVFGPGCGDNAGAALGLGQKPGDTTISLGTSGVVATVSAKPVPDASGSIAGFADATGNYLPLACTLNAAQILDSAKNLLGIDDFDTFNQLASQAEPGAGGLVYVAYLNGERTPNLPTATGTVTGMTLSNLTRENFARAAVEALACLIGHALELMRRGGAEVTGVTVTGGAAKSAVVRDTIAAVTGCTVTAPPPGEYVARGAARQAAWVLTGQCPDWPIEGEQTVASQHHPEILDRYLAVVGDYERFMRTL